MTKQKNTSHAEKFAADAFRNGEAVWMTPSGMPVAIGKGSHDIGKAIETTPPQKP